MEAARLPGIAPPTIGGGVPAMRQGGDLPASGYYRTLAAVCTAVSE